MRSARWRGERSRADRSALPPPRGGDPTASAPDWAALARSLSGTLVRPGDPAYDAARILYNTRFDGVRPQGVARCASPDDVRACVAFAAQTGVPLALRSGGHSYGGWSTGPGLVIDTGPLSAIQPGQEQVTVGAGARLIDIYAALPNAGFPGGSCATVGITGLALGGGVGVMSRRWGLTCDDLISATVVTADAQLRACDAQHEPDLYWALRGGGGSFGVVTSVTLRTHVAGPVVLAFLSWPYDKATAVIGAWQQWQRQAPDELWSNLHLDAGPQGDPSLTLYAVHAGDVASLVAELDRLDAIVGVRASRGVRASSYLDTMLLDAGCAGRTNALAALTRGLVGPPAGTSASVIFDALGGAVGRVSPDATAFPHRSALGVMQFIVSWSASAAGIEPAALAWLRSFHEAVRAQAGTAAYANYADPDLPDWPQAYYGANYARLQQVKRAYDPKGLFAFPQSIRPA
ncbi:MAG: FAD-binding oxidoreductase [Chloroflexi bacterium]|nr:MAG: FAD-binding oxidoreductase [Chloroflexota bacterium]